MSAVVAASKCSNNHRQRSERNDNRSRSLMTRRFAFLSILPATVVYFSSSSAHASVDDKENPLIQDLLAKTAANRDRRSKERLNDYYKRNFKEYFEFIEGSNMDTLGISPETQKEIRQWLDENTERTTKRSFP